MKDADAQRIDNAIDKLIEHFDSIRIFVTQHDGATDTTRSYTIGRGNFHAQRGQIAEWLARQDQYEREQAKRDSDEEEE